MHIGDIRTHEIHGLSDIPIGLHWCLRQLQHGGGHKAVTPWSFFQQLHGS
jgi:hypothetical protein